MIRAFCAVLFVLLFVPTAQANHGPGTSGGASYTVSGETLKQGKFDLSLREDYTQFADMSQASIERHAIKGGESGGVGRISHSSPDCRVFAPNSGTGAPVHNCRLHSRSASSSKRAKPCASQSS